MDIISTIKVRNADGSYSDSMPIGTVSDYVTVAADGSSLSSILGNVDLNRYGSIQSQINALGGGSGVADGVVYVGDDPEDTDDIPNEKINGISFDAEGDVLKAYWQADGEYKEAQLAPSTGGSGGGFNEIYAETSMNLGRVADSLSGAYSITAGEELIASGDHSCAIGYYTIASGYCSHAEGYYTIAKGSYQHVQGKYNIEDSYEYAHIVGGGTSDTDRKNIHTLDWSGNAVFAGDVTDGNGDSIASLAARIAALEAINIAAAREANGD